MRSGENREIYLYPVSPCLIIFVSFLYYMPVDILKPLEHLIEKLVGVNQTTKEY